MRRPSNSLRSNELALIYLVNGEMSRCRTNANQLIEENSFLLQLMNTFLQPFTFQLSAYAVMNLHFYFSSDWQFNELILKNEATPFPFTSSWKKSAHHHVCMAFFSATRSGDKQAVKSIRNQSNNEFKRQINVKTMIHLQTRIKKESNGASYMPFQSTHFIYSSLQHHKKILKWKKYYVWHVWCVVFINIDSMCKCFG